MTWTHEFPTFYKFIILIGFPIVNAYNLLCSNIFLSTAAEDATHLEWVGNQLLTPWQYLFVGQQATPTSDEEVPYELSHKFSYDEYWTVKTFASYLLLPSSLVWGATVKGASYLWEGPKDHHRKIAQSLNSSVVRLNTERYRSIGITLNQDSQQLERITSQGHKRRGSGDQHMTDDRRTLKDVVAILEEEKIPYWVDCGTCLGCYRYGGVIPWDNDIDIAILKPDSDNVRRALNRLDPKKYVVIDWSSRGLPKTYLKVYARGTDVLLDIYHYDIDEEEGTFQYILSNEDNIFMSDEWRSREREYKKPVSYDTIFPLKRGEFDGIEVMVPNKIEDYLRLRYGENLDPVMIYNEATDRYEKDLAHPFWSLKVGGG